MSDSDDDEFLPTTGKSGKRSRGKAAPKGKGKAKAGARSKRPKADDESGSSGITVESMLTDVDGPVSAPKVPVVMDESMLKGDYGAVDYRAHKYPLKDDHAKRPLWITPAGR
jgi:hypothetical protein